MAEPASQASRLDSELDQVTLERAKRGDPLACRALVARYQTQVHALCWRMLGSRGRGDLAEDLTQEAFLRAFGALSGFVHSGPARLSTWLLSIAARTAIDELRRRNPPVTSLEDVVVVGSDSPERATERAHLARAIARTVDELGPELRATFILRAYHELTYEEVAAALGVDLGTVKSRLWRAKRALQSKLEEVHDD